MKRLGVSLGAELHTWLPRVLIRILEAGGHVRGRGVPRAPLRPRVPSSAFVSPSSALRNLRNFLVISPVSADTTISRKRLPDASSLCSGSQASRGRDLVCHAHSCIPVSDTVSTCSVRSQVVELFSSVQATSTYRTDHDKQLPKRGLLCNSFSPWGLLCLSYAAVSIEDEEGGTQSQHINPLPGQLRYSGLGDEAGESFSWIELWDSAAGSSFLIA